MTDSRRGISSRIVIITILVYVVTYSLMAQSPGPKIMVSPSLVETVKLSTIVGQSSPLVDLSNTNLPLASTIIAVENRSDHAILGISGLWKIRDTSGREKRTRHQCDVFLPAGVGRVIAAPKMTVYLGPNSCLTQGLENPDLARTVTMLERESLPLLTNVAEIDIIVDAVIFGNGDMFAVNTSYANDINDRVLAANALAGHIRNEITRGITKQRVVESLREAGRSTAGYRGSWFRDFGDALVSLWSRNQTQNASKADQAFDNYVSMLERLRAPNIRLTKRP